MIFITKIADSIHKPDEELNALIEQYILDNKAKPSDVLNWRAANYALLRGWAYPKQAEYLDAVVKISAADPVISAEGQAQLASYNTRCLLVKQRFPKQ